MTIHNPTFSTSFDSPIGHGADRPNVPDTAPPSRGTLTQFVLLILGLVVALVFGLLLVDDADAGTGEQVTLESPVSGSITSGCGQHHVPYGEDWSCDIGAGAGSAVRANFANATGSLSLTVRSVTNACTSWDGGKAVRIDARVDGVYVGWYLISHLANVSVSNGQTISNGQQIGTVFTRTGSNASCWTGPHAHVGGYNQPNYPNATYDWSCTTALPVGRSVSTATALGVLGGGYVSGANQTCPSGATNPADPPSAPGRPSCTANNIGSISVSWPAASNNGATIDRYDVRYKNTASGAVSSWANNGTSRTRNYSSLGLGTGYQFQSRAHNSQGWSPSSSWSVTCVPRKAPGVPAALAVTPAGTEIGVDFEPAAANGSPVDAYQAAFENLTATEFATVSLGTATSGVVDVSNSADAYRVRVRAHNGAGWSPWSQWSTYVTPIPGPAISLVDVDVDEGNTGTRTVAVALTLDAPAPTPVSVNWIVSNGTASSPDDYDTTSGTLSLAAGSTTASIDVVVHGDELFETDETATVTLTKVTGATISDGDAHVTIINDDEAPRV